MEHAGFDGLHNPLGALLVAVSLLMLTAVIIAGSFFVKAAMKREKAVRDAMRQAYLEKKKQ